MLPLLAGLAGSKAVNTETSVIDTVVTWRDDQYAKSAPLIEAGNNAGAAATFASAFLVDCVLPVDLANVMSKTFQGKSDEITDDDIFAAGIDAIVLAIDIATFGIGAIPVNILKGGAKLGIKAGLRGAGVIVGGTPIILNLLDDDDPEVIPDPPVKDKDKDFDDGGDTGDNSPTDENPSDDSTDPTITQTGGGFWDTQTIGGSFYTAGAGVSLQSDKTVESYLMPAIIAGAALLILGVAYVVISKISTKGANHGSKN